MNKSDWGPPIWRSIHYVSLGYPVNPTQMDRRNFKEYFNNISLILPCDQCKKHYTEYLKSMPIDKALGSREALFKWTVDLHNKVNISLGKPTMPLESARMLYVGKRKVDITFLVAAIIIMLLICRYAFVRSAA